MCGIFFAAACGLLAMSSTGAQASIVSEIRGGLLDHATTLTTSGREDGVDANLELVFAPIGLLLSAHPFVGTSFNNDPDNTDQVYLGLAWDGQPVGNLLLRFGLGAARHNGELLRFSDDVRGLGNRNLIYLAMDIGWRFSPRIDVSLFYQHLSNGPFRGGDRDVNDGLDNIGLRLGYHFGDD